MDTISSEKLVQAGEAGDHLLCCAERRKLEETIAEQAAEITDLRRKLAQAEHHLDTQRQHFTGVMMQYTSIVQEIEQMHRKLEREGAAALKTIASNTKRLLNEQTTLCGKKTDQFDAFYQRELAEREEAHMLKQAKTQETIWKVSRAIESLRKHYPDQA